MIRGRRVAPRLPAAVVAFLGAGAVALSFGLQGTQTMQRTGNVVPVNRGARDPGNIQVNNSPTLVRNPVHADELAVVHRVDGPRYTCGMNVTRDGGASWSPVALAIPRGEEPKCFAPDAAYGADGTLYVAYVTLRGRGNVPHAVWLVRSTDGGRTLSPPRRVAGPRAFQVRVATDPRRPERLYLTWVQPAAVGFYRFAGADNPILAMRSDDGGVSWGPHARVSAPRRVRVIAPAPAVAPDGTVYVLYLDLGDDRLDYEGGHDAFGGPPYAGRFSLVMGRSRDAGARWEESVVDRAVVPTRRFVVFLPPAPSIAVDARSGRIYAAFEDARLGAPDVYVWALGAGSGRWSRPVRVNDTVRRDRTAQYLPKVSVAPTGRLDVLYYDRRADPRNVRTEVSLQSSFDEGRTFSRRLGLGGRPFDSRIGAGAERGLPDLGSRLGLVSADREALAVWTDTRAGTEASSKQDIAFARARFSAPPQLGKSGRNALRYGGFGLLAISLTMLLTTRGAPLHVPRIY